MKKTIYTFIFLSILFIYSNIAAQNKRIDSLLNLIRIDKEDTNKVNHLNALSRMLVSSKPDTAMILCNQALDIATKQSPEWKKGIANSLGNLGIFNAMKGNNTNALDYYLKALKIDESIHNKNGIASRLGNIGSIYKEQGDYPKALDYYLKALKLGEELGDKNRMAIQLSNIGLIYQDQVDYSKALEYSIKALKLAEELGDKILISTNLGNIGVCYKELADYPKALDYYLKALKLAEELGNKNLIASTLGNIGVIYKNQEDYTNALDHFLKALKIDHELNNKKGMAIRLGNIGLLYSKTGKYPEAEKYLTDAGKMFKEIGAQDMERQFEENLSNLYEKTGQTDLALQHYKKAMSLKDTLFNAESKKQLVKKEMNFEFEKKEMAAKAEEEKKDLLYKETTRRNKLEFEFQEEEQTLNSDKEKKELAYGEKLKRIELKGNFDKKKLAAKAAQDKIDIENKEHDKQQRFILFSVAGVLILVAVFALFMYSRFKTTKKQKQIIELQKEEVSRQKIIVEQQKSILEEHQKEIIDSINYAERIQRSFIATKEILNENLKDHFVLFKPKDIVSGDFYWAGKLNNGNFALVTADSTGHGVPGAIMSLLNVTSLEKAVETHTQAADILNATRLTIIERLKKDGSEEGGKDGMDASLTIYNFETNKLFIAAANNPVWIVRGAKIIEIKPDKMPLGKHDMDSISFTQQEIDLQAGDVVYTLTDGFPDQFGGANGKKFKYKQLQDLLLSIANEPMETQRQKLNDVFDNWKGDLEQIDDVCLIGVRV